MSHDVLEMTVETVVAAAGEGLPPPPASAIDASPGPRTPTKQHPLLESADVKAIESFEVQAASVVGKRIASFRLYIAVFLCCFSPVLYGFSLGFTSPTQSAMEGTAKGDSLPPEHLAVFTPGEFTLYASVFNLGAVIGALAGASSMDHIGRKRSMAFSAWPHVVAWTLTVFLHDPAMLIAMRMLTGFAVGLGCAVAPCYISEVAPPDLRGPLGASIQLSATLGVLLVSVVGAHKPVADEVDGELFGNWRRLSLLGVALAVVLSTMAFMPESPKWLVERGRMVDAKRSLRRLRGGDTTAEEAELEASSFAGWSSNTSPSSFRSTESHWTRLRDYSQSLLVATALLAFQPLCGIGIIMMYATDICAQAGLEDAELSSIAVMAMQVVLTALSCILVEAIGRRPLLKFAGATMCVAHLILSYYMAAQDNGWWSPSWLALAALSLYIVGYSTGMGPVPWLIVAEVFPTEAVGSASAFATAISWAVSFAVSVGFRGLQAKVGPSGAFALFAASCLGCLVFIIALVPETKGKTLEQILLDLRGGSARGVVLATPDSARTAWRA